MKKSERLESIKALGMQKLVVRVFELEDENEKLKKEQQEFQDELKKEIDKIKAMKGFNRFWASLKLLWSLINTIEQGFKE